MEKTNNAKFTSDLLNRPFSSTTDKDKSETLNISHDKTSIASKKPRKPFDNKLSFSAKGDIFDREESFNESGSFAESQMTGYTALNNQEKKTIKDLSRQLSSDMLNKAKLCNSQFDTEIPYWIKIFTDIEKNSDVVLPTYSSYFKSNDRNKYIENLIEMCKRDAELYDANTRHNKIKLENRNNIKSLLITGVDTKEDDNISVHSESNNVKSEIVANDKLLNVLHHYDHIEKKENKLQTRLGSFNEYKAKSIDTTSKKKKVKDNNPESYLNKYAYPKIETINEKEIPLYLTIDSYNFAEDDFSELEFQGGVMEGEGYRELMEIDKKLNKLDPQRYTSSINTELKKIKNELAETRDTRMKDIEMRYKKKIDMVKTKEPKRTVVFEGSKDVSEKTKHRDYLQDIKKQKQEKEILDNIDHRIRSLPAEEIKEERKLALIKEVDDMLRSNEERYKQEMARKIPEEVNCLRMEGLMKEIEELTENNKTMLNKYSEKVEKEEEMTNDEIDNVKQEEEQKALKLAYNILIDKAIEEQVNNKGVMDKVDQIYDNICKEENEMKGLENRMRIIAEESQKYDKLFKEYEDLIEMEDENNTENNL
jgi:hypothetical protein